ncbi:MAG: hypothetical protein HYS86_04685 [Candidatus Chisholmbacteria bacterium]|nr:hypothetical protein [Candidatus Chisholmbacteria bacterium]
MTTSLETQSKEKITGQLNQLIQEIQQGIIAGDFERSLDEFEASIRELHMQGFQTVTFVIDPNANLVYPDSVTRSQRAIQSGQIFPRREDGLFLIEVEVPQIAEAHDGLYRSAVAGLKLAFGLATTISIYRTDNYALIELTLGGKSGGNPTYSFPFECVQEIQLK